MKFGINTMSVVLKMGKTFLKVKPSEISIFNATRVVYLSLIPYLFHCPYKSLNSSSEIYPIFHW